MKICFQWKPKDIEKILENCMKTEGNNKSKRNDDFYRNKL